MSESIIEDDNIQSPQPDSKWNPAPFRGWQGISACPRVFQACARLCSRAFFCWNMCFRGSFSGGASAKDKGHRGHRERFFCSSGFQIIQGRCEGASRPSVSPFLSLLAPSLIEFPSLECHTPSVRRRPRPNHTFLPAPVPRPKAAPSGAVVLKTEAQVVVVGPDWRWPTAHLHQWTRSCQVEAHVAQTLQKHKKFSSTSSCSTVDELTLKIFAENVQYLWPKYYLLRNYYWSSAFLWWPVLLSDVWHPPLLLGSAFHVPLTFLCPANGIWNGSVQLGKHLLWGRF